ncbi:hypothetical protein [Sphingobacterium sp. IITKGP-BTPF85]|uniref:hypothetical protein n=1 Tax=Sphingobacterium sp. IITKGP-BTPF85 TaxID=1338009 RepID=UPI00038A12BC|nr:hypothetical protein [Sphingobacterium sp. IITKGP-BTPF85]KKX47963.1 hypothetical protein L950_0223535 [Sphingobacterium sp. IITKGP-BTPF85]
MKYILLLILTVNISISNAQKLYVWCPEHVEAPVRNDILRSDTVTIAFFDARILNKKSKIECNSEILTDKIFEQIKQVYPNIFFIKDNSLYRSKDSINTILKIGISAYHAGFGTDISVGIGMVGGSLSTMILPKGMWNASTTFYTEITDRKKSNKETISNIGSQDNIWGYKSARKALNESYNKSLQQLLFFIDQNI